MIFYQINNYVESMFFFYLLFEFLIFDLKVILFSSSDKLLSSRDF